MRPREAFGFWGPPGEGEALWDYEVADESDVADTNGVPVILAA